MIEWLGVAAPAAVFAWLARQAFERTREAKRSASLAGALHDLRDMLDVLPSMLGYWDEGLHNGFANRAYASWFGVAPDAVRGRHMRDLLGADLFQSNFPYVERALRGETVTFERSIPRPDRKGLRHSLAHYLPHVVDGQVRGFYALVHDVTELVESRQQLAVLRREAEQANEAKSRFVANMSHEIRTPLNAIIGLAHLLERTPLAGEQAGFVANIQLAGRSLLALVNDVLDLSKIEAAELRLERTAFSLRGAIDDVVKLVRLQAEAKGLAFVIDIGEDVHDGLEGDPARLQQVLMNLLANAVKFTERGTVTLHVREQEGAGGVLLRFSVRDTGIGIGPEAMARLFLPFAQSDASTTRRFGGTGLGLSIVKQLAERMGGAVSARSAPGEGSEFHVELPFGLAELVPHDAPLEPQRPRGLDGVRLLVADDNQINLQVARRILEHEGAEVFVARDGEEAARFVLSAAHVVDVVLMDLQMPVLDGFDAARRIRADARFRTLPIIALTAGSLSSEQQHASAAGMDDFLSKPFEPRALVRCIRAHVPA